jgi:flagellar M-ring protein FliF
MDQVKKLILSLSTSQRWAIVICALAVVGAVVGLSHWQRESGLRPLYTGLSPEDAGAIVQKLKESGVDYRVSENGTTLLVPDSKVPELRLEMAGLGLPKTGRIGFEIFDKTNFGITDFAEHVNYRRAVEGELERSIMALAEVQQARIHVTLPKESVFLESRESAKASVLVGLRPGARLSPQNVLAITNLVSSAVEGLTPESVSVVDMHGNLLSRPRRDGLADNGEITVAALEYRQAVERDLVVKINNTLEPLLGADKFRTGVSAEVDMSSGEQSEEIFDPTKSVMVTSQKTEDTNSVTHPAATPGTAANLPQAPPVRTANTTGSTKRTENVSYQTSRTTKHLKLPQGALKRLSIAVLLDQTVKWEGQGNQVRRIIVPPAAEKLKTIQSVVASIVGLNTQRGDQLTVETLPFDNTLNVEQPLTNVPAQQKKPENSGPLDGLKNKPVIWGAAAGAILIVIVLIVAVLRSKKKRSVVEVEEPLQLPVSHTIATSPAAPQAVNQANGANMAALPPSRTEALLMQLQDSGKNNPELWAGILRGWLGEEEAS